MADDRTPTEKALWERIGPPLYYCAECMRGVKVTPVDGAEPIVQRKCEHTGQIIAPRRAICVGKGGASMGTKVKIAVMQLASAVTGRTV